MIDIKCVAKKVVSDEAEAVRNLLNYIDEDFEKVVKLIYESKGRVIITGIGKSAIIAQKIVATLNSTGTPAVFYMLPMRFTGIWGWYNMKMSLFLYLKVEIRLKLKYCFL